MTTYDSTYYPDQYEYLPSPEAQSAPPGWVVGVHFFAFLGLAMAFVQPAVIFGTTENVIVRWAGYVMYILFVLAVGGIHLRNLLGAEKFFLVLVLLMIPFMVLTNLTVTTHMSMLDHLSPPTLVLGVYVFTFGMPRALGRRAETVLLLVTIVMAVTSAVSGRRALDQSNVTTMFSGAAGLCFLVMALRKTSSPHVRLAGWAGCALMAVLMLLSRGRTSIAAFGATAMLIVWFGSGLKGKTFWLLLLGGLAIGLLATEPGQQFMDFFLTKGRTARIKRFEIGQLTGRVDVWKKGFEAAGGILWLGKGKWWLPMVTGMATHSTYLALYFNYGVFVLAAWLAVGALGTAIGIKITRWYRHFGHLSAGPAVVIYMLIIGLAENWFMHAIGALGAIFYIGLGICFCDLHEIRDAQESYWGESDYDEEAYADAEVIA